MGKVEYIYPRGMADEDTLYEIIREEKARLQYNTDIKYAKDEGLAEGKAGMIISMYSRGQSPEFISEITDISLDEIKKILNI